MTTMSSSNNAEARRGKIAAVNIDHRKENMHNKQNGTRCKARTEIGKPCRAFATESGLCFFHGNPNKARELGRIGGRKNRHVVAEGADPLPALESALAVRQTGARVIEDVISGRLSPRIASGLAALLSLQLRAIETTDLERRLAKLEQLRAEADTAEGLDGRKDAPSLDFGDLSMPKSS